ncbi:hypothetical protein LTR17_021315 [Elasticomyces elasticus]|nr:hypothetical protein LTR17_021315 [Elasticomyces elasticus]
MSQQRVIDLNEKLAERLPGYMIPNEYIPVKELPRTTFGNLDRPYLRRIGASYTIQELAAFCKTPLKHRKVSSDMEYQLQQLCSIVLGIEAETIDADHDFGQLGENSIRLMELLRKIKQTFGVQISTEQFLEHQYYGNSLN